MKKEIIIWDCWKSSHFFRKLSVYILCRSEEYVFVGKKKWYVVLLHCASLTNIHQEYRLWKIYAGLRPGWSGVWDPAGAGNFSLHHASGPALGPTEPPIWWVPRALSLKVKRSWREADPSPLSSASFKNARSYSSTPPKCFHGVVLS